MAIVQKLKEYGKNYGVAWFVVNQTVGWITYFAIYFFLVFSNINILGYLSQFSYTKSIVDAISPTAGNLAVAFALNRLGTPFRILITTALMPYFGESINDFVNPYLIKWGLFTVPPEKDDDGFPGVEFEGKKNK
ncbi:hypothetical protein BC833DRAFT_622072 [Globomyces pollinis-pini]|nr:hypothetical protein BC833DRAFT_622072 [Globomyces pollinis-pini]